jgi:hypothetical protein
MLQSLRGKLFIVLGALLATGLAVAAAAPGKTDAGKPGSPQRAAAAARAATAPDPFPDPAWVKSATRPTAASQPAKPPVTGVDHVVIISIDGCRPDVLLRNDTKNIKALFNGGTYTFWARTTPNSITLPSHVSMLTGVNPRKHGVEWNRDMPFYKPMYPNYPTAFYYAKRYGYTTGMAAGKSKFDALTVPGTIDYESVPEKAAAKDPDVALAGAKMIAAHKPNLVFVHLPGNDSAGHRYGWGSPEQSKAVVEADEAVGHIVDAVREAGLAERTVLIITADHGGAGKSHGPDDARCRHIPWIASGPGVRKGVDLTGDAELEVRTEDTFATACWLLGIPLDTKRIDGRPVVAAFQTPQAGPELLKPQAGK